MPSSCPLSGKPRPLPPTLTLPPNSPQYRQQTQVDIHCQKSHQSLEKNPKEAHKSCATTPHGHLSSLCLTNRNHPRTSRRLQSIAFVFRNNPKSSPAALSCHLCQKTRSTKTFNIHCCSLVPPQTVRLPPSFSLLKDLLIWAITAFLSCRECHCQSPRGRYCIASVMGPSSPFTNDRVHKLFVSNRIHKPVRDPNSS